MPAPLRRGFTLLELLLTLLILGFLLALLFPVLANARRSSRISVCTSNLKQLAAAAALYQADYGYLPKPTALAQSLPDPRVLFCPADPGQAPRETGSSYVFRAQIPPHFRPVWEVPDVDPNVVLISCTQHLERRPSENAGPEGPPRQPFRLVLRAGGAVEKIREDQVREIALPHGKYATTRVYPGEPAYASAGGTP